MNSENCKQTKALSPQLLSSTSSPELHRKMGNGCCGQSTTHHLLHHHFILFQGVVLCYSSSRMSQVWSPSWAVASALPWYTVGCRKAACSNVIFSKGCRETPALVPGAPPLILQWPLCLQDCFSPISHSSFPAAVVQQIFTFLKSAPT